MTYDSTRRRGRRNCRRFSAFLVLFFGFAATFAHAAILTVDTTVDEFDVMPNGACSLREAVESANDDADFGGCVGDGVYGDDTIILPAGTYGLTQTPPEPFLELDNSVGDLDVGFVDIFGELLRVSTSDRGGFAIDSLEILGEGAETTIIERASAEIFGIFQIAPPTALRLVDLTVTGGQQVAGAGIFAAFELDLERVVVRDNEARAPDAGGGGIVALDVLTLVDTLVTNNQVFLEDPCSFGPDTTGGGIFAFPFEILIERSTVSDNVVTGDPECEGFGGGMGLLAGTFPARIVNSTFSGNSADYAGGIDLLAESFLFFPELGPDPGPLANNPRGQGRPANAPAWTQGSTSARLRMADRLEHGIISPEPEPVFIEHVTIANNSATDVGGLSIISFDETGEVVLENTLIGDNTADDAPDCTLFRADVTSQGTNLLSIDDPFEGDDVCLTQPPDLVGTLAAPLDPVLGPLQDNGGETPTQALLSGSPALDAAPDQGETEDQRGVPRPQGAGFDIGAFEANEVDLTITKSDSDDPVQRGASFTYVVTAENLSPNPAVDVVISDSIPIPLTPTAAVPSAGGTCDILLPPAPFGGGSVTCTFPGATEQGEPRTVTITVDGSADAQAGSVVVNEAFVSSSSPEVDPDPNPNEVQETTTIAAADLSITKTAEVTEDMLTFVITVTNLGPDDAVDVVIDDPLPLGAAFVSATPSMGGVCTTPAVGEEGGTVSCFFAGPTAPAEQRSVVIETVATRRDVVNTATTSSATGDPVPDPNPNVATTGARVLAIPTLGEWGLLLLVMSLTAAGVWTLRR